MRPQNPASRGGRAPVAQLNRVHPGLQGPDQPWAHLRGQWGSPHWELCPDRVWARIRGSHIRQTNTDVPVCRCVQAPVGSDAVLALSLSVHMCGRGEMSKTGLFKLFYELGWKALPRSPLRIKCKYIQESMEEGNKWHSKWVRPVICTGINI